MSNRDETFSSDSIYKDARKPINSTLPSGFDDSSLGEDTFDSNAGSYGLHTQSKKFVTQTVRDFGSSDFASGLNSSSIRVPQTSNCSFDRRNVVSSSIDESGPRGSGVGKEINALVDFGAMVEDMRRVFTGFTSKTELEFKRLTDDIIKERRELEEERSRVLAQLSEEKTRETDKIRRDRQRADQEMQNQMKQVQTERDAVREKVRDAWQKFEREKDLKIRALDLDYQRLMVEKNELAEEKKRVLDQKLASQTIVEFNVGGTIFESTRKTLCAQPDSLLGKLFAGKYDLARDQKDRPFFDRDATIFQKILNFLRQPDKVPVPATVLESETFVQEASFYNIRFYNNPLVFSVGGHSGTEFLRSIEVLDIEENQWMPRMSMNTERVYFGAGHSSGRMFVFGGQNLDYKALAETEIYDVLRDSWQIGSSLNIPRRNCAGVSLNDGRIAAIGGFDGSSILQSVELYDPRMRNWVETTPLLTLRSSPMACVSTGDNGISYIWVMGGTSGTRLRTTERFDLRAMKWELLENSSLLEERSAGAAVSFLGKLFCFGGVNQSHEIHGSVEVMSTGNSSQRAEYCRSSIEPRMDFSAVNVRNEKILLGGGQNQDVLNSVESYFPQRDEWQNEASMIFARYGHQLQSIEI